MTGSSRDSTRRPQSTWHEQLLNVKSSLFVPTDKHCHDPEICRSMDDLVELTRMGETEVGPERTTHRTYQGQNRWQSEIWIKIRELGSGTYGDVWLEEEAQSQSEDNKIFHPSRSTVTLTPCLQECAP
jgi:hypothetical protein